MRQNEVHSEVWKLFPQSSTYVEGDTEEQLKPKVDLNLECSAILPGQWIATVAAPQLQELSGLSQQEVFIILLCHPVPALRHVAKAC